MEICRRAGKTRISLNPKPRNLKPGTLNRACPAFLAATFNVDLRILEFLWVSHKKSLARDPTEGLEGGSAFKRGSLKRVFNFREKSSEGKRPQPTPISTQLLRRCKKECGLAPVVPIK